ncbi:MAG: hypothetical protein A2Y72_06920 [Chloroflexi bacterium RBG_13_53_26]|nr:MAG: hypothetical protein A2Y72_06920 [Chloroflexi bacterium RBG_13_53_26]
MIWILVFTSIISFSADMTSKGLALADAYLGYFATVTPAGQMNICGTVWTIYNAELTACGTTFVRDSVVETVMQLAYMAQDLAGMTNILLGLLAV